MHLLFLFTTRVIFLTLVKHHYSQMQNCFNMQQLKHLHDFFFAKKTNSVDLCFSTAKTLGSIFVKFPFRQIGKYISEKSIQYVWITQFLREEKKLSPLSLIYLSTCLESRYSSFTPFNLHRMHSIFYKKENCLNLIFLKCTPHTFPFKFFSYLFIRYIDSLDTNKMLICHFSQTQGKNKRRGIEFSISSANLFIYKKILITFNKIIVVVFQDVYTHYHKDDLKCIAREIYDIGI